MTHPCPGGCGHSVPAARLSCGFHWSLVPKHLQNRVYLAWGARVDALSRRWTEEAGLEAYLQATRTHEAARAAAVDAVDAVEAMLARAPAPGAAPAEAE